MTSNGAILALSTGAPQRFTVYELLSFVFSFIPGFAISVPLAVLFHHFVHRNSAVTRVVGRPLLADFVVRLNRFYMSRCTPAQGRILFNRKSAYSRSLSRISGFKEWTTYEEGHGTAWRVIAPPGTERAQDDVVLLFVHGGGFVLDSGASSMAWLAAIATELNLKRNVQASIFFLDYRLAPEYKYPSQVIELLAIYHHLVNTLGIPESKICIGGDSAGGNLVAALLLHLARPNPSIHVPESLGPTPSRPEAALLISPFVKLVSHLPSRLANEDFDYIESNSSFQAALHYVDAKWPGGPVGTPSWNPLHWIKKPFPSVPRGIVNNAKGFTVAKEAEMVGLELLSSPYVNPSVVAPEDLSWWKEAMPGDKMTLVTFGGKEIFCDDIAEFVANLKSAGVQPATVCKPLGAHDWLMFDSFVPGVWKTHDDKPFDSATYGVDVTVDFLQEIYMRQRRSHWAAIAQAKARNSQAEGSVIQVERVP